MKRAFDLALAIVALVLLAVPMIIIAAVVRSTSRGPALYWSERIGQNNQIFRMPKYRSMRLDTPAVATHLLQRPDSYLTPIGATLRRTSLDELPQLFCILRGEMSFVGPRPALFNQDDLVTLRTQHGVHLLKPGLTGWAQINGRDELSIPQKVRFDAEYLERRSFALDTKIIALTAWRAVKGAGVSH